jgi:hypothetical protein
VAVSVVVDEFLEGHPVDTVDHEDELDHGLLSFVLAEAGSGIKEAGGRRLDALAAGRRRPAMGLT